MSVLSAVALWSVCWLAGAAFAGTTGTPSDPAHKNTQKQKKSVKPAAASAAHPANSRKKSKTGSAKLASTKPASKKTKSGSKTNSRKAVAHKPRGQQKIDPERSQAIQEALIREHYMNGEASGTWNQSCEDAMRKYQADHGWQSKTVPDSRALISLGLGPSNDHLLNPESAMTTTAAVSHAAVNPAPRITGSPGGAAPAEAAPADSSQSGAVSPQ